MPNAYRLWNDALAKRFFNPSMAGRSVHLYVSQDIISDMEKVNPDLGDFYRAIHEGYLPGSESICYKALRTYTRWNIDPKDRRIKFPPYIAYLCFFVLAGDIDGDFHSNAYYPRLREISGIPGTGPLPSFDQMGDLWNDLEYWSQVDRNGELGNFHARPAGGHVHIGYPLSQSALAEQDRRALPKVFYNAGLEPSSPYPDDEIARAIRSSTARHLLRTRTFRIAGNPSHDLYGTLIDAVVDELDSWDGTISESPDALGSETRYAPLRICLNLDSVSGAVKACLRCEIRAGFPENGIELEGSFVAVEDNNGWSLPISNDRTGNTLIPSLADWNDGKIMRSTTQGWGDLRLQKPRGAYPARVFINGNAMGISGLVEVHSIPMDQPFYLAYPGTSWPHLEQWATTQCQGFQEIEVFDGLPDSWQLAEAQKVTGIEGVKDVFPSLGSTSNAKLNLEGGIRNGAWNNFFRFAPPAVSLKGGSSNTRVYCNDIRLRSSGVGGVFVLPQDLAVETRITLEARNDTSVVARQYLFLTGDFQPRGDAAISLDVTGVRLSNDNVSQSVSGAYIQGAASSLTISAQELFEDFEHEIGNVRGFLIGQLPGQIVAWPAGAFPSEWMPVWAIRKVGRKKVSAVYLGKIFRELAFQSTELASPSRRNVQLWKKILWHGRKRVSPPASKAERDLWMRIQEVAKDV